MPDEEPTGNDDALFEQFIEIRDALEDGAVHTFHIPKEVLLSPDGINEVIKNMRSSFNKLFGMHLNVDTISQPDGSFQVSMTKGKFEEN